MHRMWSGKRADCSPGSFRLQSVTPRGQSAGGALAVFEGLTNTALYVSGGESRAILLNIDPREPGPSEVVRSPLKGQFVRGIGVGRAGLFVHPPVGALQLQPTLVSKHVA